MKHVRTPHKLITALFAMLFTLTLHNISNAETHIHVDAVNGMNAVTGRGTAGNAYKSITYALLISQRNNLPDPWHVHIHPGTYDADPEKPPNEREVFPLKLRSEMVFEGTTTAAECIIDAQHLSEIKTPILLGEEVGDVSIRNLTIQNMQAADGASGITLLNQDGATNRIEACISHNNTRDGISTNTPLVLIGNTFSEGSRVHTSANIVATNNVFKDSGLSVSAPNSSAIGIDISGNIFESSGIYVWSSLVTGNIIGNEFSGGESFKITGSSSIGSLTGDISHNTFHKNYGGFYVQHLLTGNVTHNIFTENGVDWSDNTGGFRVGAMVGNVTHNTFKGNISRDGVAGFLVDGHFRGEITHNRFEGNSVYQPSTHYPKGIAVSVGGGLHNSSETNIKIANNIFANNTGSGELTYVVYTNGPAVYLNNLFMVVDGLAEAVPVPTIGMFNVRNPSSPEIGLHNNIFSGMRTAIYTEIRDLPITYNLFHNIELDFVNQAGSGVGNDVEFWELLADAASNNIVGGLPLKDPSNGDFHPLVGSPTIDAGTNAYGPTDDLDGVARPINATVDIGPYEYDSSTTGGVTPTFLVWDVNEDGQVSIIDLIVVAQNIGQPVAEVPRADVNGDNVINILDLILISQHLGELAAPSLDISNSIPFELSIIQEWLKHARIHSDGSLTFQNGIAYLERLLASALPRETALLPNYPNPFNPETWIPYQLAEPAEVTIRIYAVDGSLVRVLSLGHKATGSYQNRTRAAYWDGRNSIGEPVASGVYFYTLTAGDFTATRKMLIQK